LIHDGTANSNTAEQRFDMPSVPGRAAATAVTAATAATAAAAAAAVAAVAACSVSIMPLTLQRGASGSATNAERVRNDRLFQ